MYTEYLNTDFGIATIRATDKGICELSFRANEIDDDVQANDHTAQCKDQLKTYFRGQLTQFTVPVDFAMHPPFYQKVWHYLLGIPFGETKSYLDVAIALGDKNAVRAVGTANGKNPIAIIVPCHRVIGSNGSLTGYAYGLDMKQRLLMLENPIEKGIQQQLFA